MGEGLIMLTKVSNLETKSHPVFLRVAFRYLKTELPEDDQFLGLCAPVGFYPAIVNP